MRTRLLGALGSYELVEQDDPDSDPLHAVSDPDEIHRILSGLAQDPANWGILQRLGQEVGGGGSFGEDPLRPILRAVHFGQIRLTRVVEEVRSIVLPEEESKKKPPPEPTEKQIRKLCIRFNLDPNEASTYKDRFVLRSTDGSYRSEKTMKGDKTPGDAYVDLVYTGLDEEKRFTLEIYESEGARSKIVFQDRPFADLAGVSGGKDKREVRARRKKGKRS